MMVISTWFDAQCKIITNTKFRICILQEPLFFIRLFDIANTEVPIQNSSALSPDTRILKLRSSGDGVSISMRCDDGVSTACLRSSRCFYQYSIDQRFENWPFRRSDWPPRNFSSQKRAKK